MFLHGYSPFIGFQNNDVMSYYGTPQFKLRLSSPKIKLTEVNHLLKPNMCRKYEPHQPPEEYITTLVSTVQHMGFDAHLSCECGQVIPTYYFDVPCGLVILSRHQQTGHVTESLSCSQGVSYPLTHADVL